MKDKSNEKKIYSSSNNKKQIVKNPKCEFHLYMSIDKWFSNDKIYYKIDYVLDNKVADIIPNKKIKTDSPMLNHFRINNDLGDLHIYQIPRIRPFEFSSSLKYKVVSTILQTEPNEKFNLFEKLFESKKFYIKNSISGPKIFDINKKELDSIEEIISNIFSNLTINCNQNDNNQ